MICADSNKRIHCFREKALVTPEMKRAHGKNRKRPRKLPRFMSEAEMSAVFDVLEKEWANAVRKRE